MSLFIQHGYGKSDKIHSAIDDGTAQGVILAPRSERPEKLEICIDELSSRDCEILIDPQFYVTALSPPNDQHLPDYDYYQSGLTLANLTGARRIMPHVQAAIDYQASLDVTAIVSPTVVFDSFSDRWYQIALEFADASLTYHATLKDAPPLLLSFVIGEEALASLPDVNRFLDTVTQDGWDMAGFYLIVARSDKGYSQRFDPVRMANYMYLLYSLGTINELRVICGYTDFCGIPFKAVGAEAFATGWAQSSRQFHRSTFIQRKPGGQQPRERYSSIPLCSSIFLNELQDIFDIGQLPSVLSGVTLDSVITGAASPSASDWTTAVSQRHHWQVLHKLDTRYAGSVTDNIRKLLRYLRDCQGRYRLLEGGGVQFEANTNSDHLADWIRATQDFVREVGLAIP